MKRSHTITLGLIPVLAALLTGCSGDDNKPTHQKLCVDKEQNVVDDSKCTMAERQPGQTGQSTVVHHHGGGSNAFLWYYMLTRPSGYPVGYHATGGSYVAPAMTPSGAPANIATGRVVTPSSSVTRSGFGSTSHSSFGA